MSRWGWRFLDFQPSVLSTGPSATWGMTSMFHIIAWCPRNFTIIQVLKNLGNYKLWWSHQLQFTESTSNCNQIPAFNNLVPSWLISHVTYSKIFKWEPTIRSKAGNSKINFIAVQESKALKWEIKPPIE
jgi:hypothetical protein